MSWQIILSKKAVKDIEKLKRSKLTKQVKTIFEILKKNPLHSYPSYERLVGNLDGFYSLSKSKSYLFIKGQKI